MERPSVGRRRAEITSVDAHSPGALELSIRFEDGATGRAIAYPDLVGEVVAGDHVLVNSTGVDLSLGTGGYSFVIAVLNRVPDHATYPGHLVKLRYTPHQCAVHAVEEMGSALREAANGDQDLGGCPVVACELHSQVAAVAAGFRSRRPQGQVVYLATPGGALPLGFSRLIPMLKDAGLIQTTVSVGQSFGGDLEAINVYSALLIAVVGLHADLVITGQAPGNAGTGTRFGFSGIEQGEAANAAASLGGRPVVCLRASDADPRADHRSPSHHTLTVLDRVVRCHCAVAIAREAPSARRRLILEGLRQFRLHERHTLLENCHGEPGLALLRSAGIRVTTMGRSLDDDREFFLHAAAAGDAAAWMRELAE